jgi:Ribbon-helix-helix protein, copG family
MRLVALVLVMVCAGATAVRAQWTCKATARHSLTGAMYSGAASGRDADTLARQALRQALHICSTLNDNGGCVEVSDLTTCLRSEMSRPPRPERPERPPRLYERNRDWPRGRHASGIPRLEAMEGKWEAGGKLTCVKILDRVTYMEKTQVYLRKEELDALREAAARSGRSVAELVRDAIRQAVLKPQTTGPVAIWDGEPKRTSLDHDSVHDEP